MQRVVLIYNPASGQHSARRKALIEEALAVLRGAGITAEAIVTEGAGSATSQALEAIRQGCDTILACGGDGTVHEILQGMVGSEVALGVIPFGNSQCAGRRSGVDCISRESCEDTSERVCRARLSGAHPLSQERRKLGFALLHRGCRCWSRRAAYVAPGFPAQAEAWLCALSH